MTMKEIETKYHINHRTIKKYIDKKAFLATKTLKSWNIDEDTFQEWFKLYKSGYENKQPWNRKIFNTIDSPEKAYWLGFINADGCILNSLLVGSYQLLSSVQDKFLSLIQVTPHKIMTHGKIFKISYRSKGEVYKIIKFLYGENSVSLARKQELANKIIQNYEKLC